MSLLKKGRFQPYFLFIYKRTPPLPRCCRWIEIRTYRNGIDFNFHLSFKCSQHFIKLYIKVLKNGIDKPVKKILIIKQIRLISNTRYVWRTVWRVWMLTLRLKRLTTVFLQRCTWTTNHNVVKIYLCTRYCRSHGHTAMNDEGQMKDNPDKICILTFSSTNYYYYRHFPIGKCDFLP